MGQKDITTKDYMKENTVFAVVSSVTGVEFEEDEEEEKVDMCQALREMMEEANSEGRQDERTAMARRMLKEGGFSMELIARMTGLSLEEVSVLAIDAV